jgi:hypothetical protein
MALTVEQGFTEFLSRLTPTEAGRVASAKHRASVEASLKGALEVSRFRDIGSFGHGTGVRGYYDVDLLVSIKGGRPGTSDTALNWVKNALQASFPSTNVRISRPAVVVDFANGVERWEVVPGFITGRGGKDVYVYDIPGAASGWLDSAPAEHLYYVNEVNNSPKITGGAKKLARLVKAWKYYNNVPISSFYLEMRAAKWLSTEASFNPIWDMAGLLGHLQDIGLGAMNDPKGAAGRFYACSTTPKATEALSKLNTAVTNARTGRDYHVAKDPANAFVYFDRLFGGRFPSRY